MILKSSNLACFCIIFWSQKTKQAVHKSNMYYVGLEIFQKNTLRCIGIYFIYILELNRLDRHWVHPNYLHVYCLIRLPFYRSESPMYSNAYSYKIHRSIRFRKSPSPLTFSNVISPFSFSNVSTRYISYK